MIHPIAGPNFGKLYRCISDGCHNRVDIIQLYPDRLVVLPQKAGRFVPAVQLQAQGVGSVTHVLQIGPELTRRRVAQ